MVWSKFLEEQKREEQALKKVSVICSVCSGKYNYYNMQRHCNSKKHERAVMIENNIRFKKWLEEIFPYSLEATRIPPRRQVPFTSE